MKRIPTPSDSSDDHSFIAMISRSANAVTIRARSVRRIQGCSGASDTIVCFIVGVLFFFVAVIIHRGVLRDDSSHCIASISIDDAPPNSNMDFVPSFDVEMAKFAYENQKMERSVATPQGKKWDVETLQKLAQLGANWPCFHGAEVTGQRETFREHWDRFKDGWKYTCGLRKLEAPCVVYSLGSCGNMIFEAALMRVAPFCEMHIFDKDNFGIEEWFPDAAVRSRVHFHRMFIAASDDTTKDPPRRSLESITREFEHAHIDVLKMDVEGAEFDIFGDGRAGRVPISIGQVQLEVHMKGRTSQQVMGLVEHLEECGLRMFHKEVNARYNPECVELAFVQEEWAPARKDFATNVCD